MLLTGLAVSALLGGGAFIRQPDGSLLGMSPGELATNLFHDFFWPGILLFTLFGVGGGVAFFGVLKRRSWGTRMAMVIGSALVGWIIVQVVMIEKPSFLQPLLLLVGTLITGLAARANGYRWSPRRPARTD